MNQQYVLGRLCRDKISKAEGICIGLVDWMFGCRHYMLRPVLEKKKMIEHAHEYFKVPEAYLEIVDPDTVIDVEIPAEEEARFFGDICRDKVTGYEGMCIGRVWELAAEKQYCLQGRYNKKKMRKAPDMWVDEGRIEILESKHAIKPEDVQTERKGGVWDCEIPICF